MAQSPLPITLPLVTSVLPLAIVLVSMVAGYTTLSGDVKDIKEDTQALVTSFKETDQKLTDHEVRISVMEKEQQVLGPVKPAELALVENKLTPITPSPINIINEEGSNVPASPSPQPSPSSNPPDISAILNPGLLEDIREKLFN